MAEGESFFAGSDALLAGSQYPTVGHEFWNLNDPGAGEQFRTSVMAAFAAAVKN